MRILLRIGYPSFCSAASTMDVFRALLFLALIAQVGSIFPMWILPLSREAAAGEERRAQSSEEKSSARGTISSLSRGKALPEGCLFVIRIAHIETLCREAGEILHRLDGKSDAAYLRRALGTKLHNPGLRGVDLSAPVYLFFMDRKRYPHPLVFQYCVTDAELVKQALAGPERSPNIGSDGTIRFPHLSGSLQIEDGLATWCTNPDAGAAVRSWRKTHPEGPRLDLDGQVVAHFDVQRLLGAFAEELDVETRRMKERMREAIARGGQNIEAERELAAATAELDAVLAALRQVKVAEFGLELSGKIVQMRLSASMLPESVLASFARAHVKGETALLEICPADALFVLLHNLTVKQPLIRLLAHAIGLPTLDALRPSAEGKSGQTLVAGFPCTLSGNGMVILELRTAQDADSLWKRWDSWMRRDNIPSAALFDLEPLDVDPPISDMRVARVRPNESSLGPAGMRIAQRILGENPVAAGLVDGNTSAFAIGPSAQSRVNQVRTLIRGEGRPLSQDPRFQRTVAHLMEKPNLIAYLSPEGLRGWLRLGGFGPGEPGPNEIGVVAVAGFTDQGVRAAVRFSLESLSREAPPRLKDVAK